MNSLCVPDVQIVKSTRLNTPSVSQIEQVVNGNSRGSLQSGSASRRNNDVRQDLIARRAVHQAELEQLDEELLALEDLRRQQIQNIKGLTQQIEALDEGALRGPAVIRNYFDEFEWSERLREQMRKVFGIENFRLAQEGYAILVVAGIPCQFFFSFNKYNDDLFFCWKQCVQCEHGWSRYHLYHAHWLVGPFLLSRFESY